MAGQSPGSSPVSCKAWWNHSLRAHCRQGGEQRAATAGRECKLNSALLSEDKSHLPKRYHNQRADLLADLIFYTKDRTSFSMVVWQLPLSQGKQTVNKGDAASVKAKTNRMRNDRCSAKGESQPSSLTQKAVAVSQHKQGKTQS